MRTGSRRLAAIARVAAVAALALTLATPASAQFGGLKKKLKAAAAQEGVEKVAPEAAAPAENAAAPVANAPAAGGNVAAGGTLVLDDEVIERLVTGLKAAEAEKQAAKTADTPYGRHNRAVAAYDDAQVKCGKAQTTFGSRMAADQKLNDRYGAYVEKMVQAGGRQDQVAYVAYSDSAMVMIDPACAVKKPDQPSDYYDAQRKAEAGAEQKALKASGLSQADYSQAMERIGMILGGTPPTDLSSGEKTAVEKRSKELKKLLGMEVVPAATRAAPAAAAVDTAPTPPAQPVPTVSPAQQAMGACYAQNAQQNEARLVDLGNRGEAAQKANDTATMMAIADTINRIQSAGCNPGR